MENDPLLKIAVWYALLFSEQTLEDSERIDEETFKVDLGEKSDLLILPVERSSVAQKPDEAFADAVEVYVRRMDEVDPKGAARLRRAIRAGYLEFTSAPFDIVTGWDEMTRADVNSFIGKHIWIMPRRENFTDAIGVQPHDKDGGIEAAAAAGSAAGRDFVCALRDTLAHELERADEGNESDSILIRLSERCSEFTKPTINVQTLPSFGGFVGMCIVAAVILCSVVLIFRFLGLW